jgi:hypothetical protein
VTSQVPLTLDADGALTYTIAIPNDPGLIGSHVNVQWWGVDPDAGGGYAASNGVEYVIVGASSP